MSSLVLGFREIDNTQLPLVGGKGLQLGALSKIDGIQVPEGFCVTTEGFRKAMERSEAYRALLDQLTVRNADERERIGEISREIRQTIMEAAIPSDVAKAAAHSLSRLGEEHAYAVRSSATAEDLPHVSFAGQQDSYLNIVGVDAVLRHIRKCWASLFTDRAVIYRMQNGFGLGERASPAWQVPIITAYGKGTSQAKGSQPKPWRSMPEKKAAPRPARSVPSSK